MTARVPLIAVIAAGAAALTLTVAFAPAPLRVVIALPLALLVPGAAIAVMAFPAGTGIGRAIDVAVAFVLSIAFYPLAALSLHAVTIRISPMTMAGSADAVVLSAVAATFIRIHRSGRRPGPVVLADGRPDLLAAARALAVVVVAVATVAIMRVVLPAPPAGAYTSFGLRGNWSHVHGIAYIDPARELMIRTDITNSTDHARRYRVRVSTPGGNWSQPSTTVAAGATWHTIVTGRVRQHPCSQRIMLALKPSALRLLLQLRVVGRGCPWPANAPQPHPALDNNF